MKIGTLHYLRQFICFSSNKNVLDFRNLTHLKVSKSYVITLILVTNLIASPLFGQYGISGKILDTDNNPLEGAFVELKELGSNTLSDGDGNFFFDRLKEGAYTLSITFLGYESVEQLISVSQENPSFQKDYVLGTDPLELSSIIVSGHFNEKSKLRSSIAITTVSSQDIQSKIPKGTADLLKTIPGTFADASTGEVFTRVYSRGISISAEDDLGWFYVSLQEDGLPVSATQHTFYSPDLFHRIDLTTQRLEAIRGGSASVTNNNSPGGIYNFISKKGSTDFGGEFLLTSAFANEENGLFRLDANLGGPIAKSNWYFNAGGFYRYDEGAREVDFNWGQGGQIKFNLQKNYRSGHIKFYAKYLNDKVNRWTGLPATNWENPQAAFGLDLNRSALMLPSVSTQIADGRQAGTNPNANFAFDSGNGIQTKDFAFGVDFSQTFGNNWRLRNNLKFSDKKADWQTSIGNNPLGLEQFTPYLLNGISPDFSVFPLGQVVFRDARSQAVIARVNNLGILGPLMGDAPTFEYLEGNLPNDAVMGIAPWKKQDEGKDIMNQISIQKQIGNHSFTLGNFTAYSDVETFTSGSFAYVTYEAVPRMLRVTLENPGEPIVELSDLAGISNYGGLFYSRADAKVLQTALFINDDWKINKQLSLDIGLRYEYISHDGQKDRFAPTSNDLDDRPETAYNNSTLVATGTVDEFDFSYDYLSWSIGLNYQLTPKAALFGRFTNGHKAPELNYYFNNFQNLPVSEAGTVQDITQAEAGLKFKSDKIALFSTAFWSRLDNVNFSEFVFDESTGELFFTPAQFNQTTTFGLELESVFSPTPHFQIRVLATLQNPEATKFTLYDANGTSDPSDDKINDFSGNEIPHNPKVSLEISPSFSKGKFNSFMSWRYMGSRQANVANAFKLPAFSTVNAGLGYEINKFWTLSLIANNVFNSAGLMNFFGPNEFGSSANAATEEFIQQNPNASFVVFPIVPRTIHLQVGYQF